MTATEFATTGQDRLARSRSISSNPGQSAHRYIYAYEDSEIVEGYKATPSTPSFNLELRRGDGYWIVQDVEIGIYGDAETVSEAIEDFELTAIAQLDILEQESALSEDLAWQLEYLRVRVRR